MLKFPALSCLPLLLALTALPLSTSVQAAESGWQQKLKSLFSSDKPEEELLPPEQAFTVTAQAIGPDKLQATLTPAPGYYLYRERIRFTLAAGSPGAIQQVTLPKGEVKDDRTFGKMEVYHRPTTATLALKQPAAGQRLTLQAEYQGCHEQSGVCYPPQEASLALTLP